MPSKIQSTNFRLTGLDLARGLAVIGMVLVNYVYVLSHDLVSVIEQDSTAIETLSPFALGIGATVLIGLAGRAAAVFLVLFGIGMSLQSRRIDFDANPGWAWPMVRRYLMLMLGGMIFIPLWEADILHYIGLYGLLVLPLIRIRTRWLLLIALGLLLGAETGRMVFQYPAGWQTGAIGSHYEDMWSFSGQFRQLFFNGYHPVFPWLSFVVSGLCLGRLDLRSKAVLNRLILAGCVSAATGFIAMALGVPADFFPADTLFILLGIANAVWIIGLCLRVSVDIELPSQGSIFNRMTRNMGRLALSHYPGHVWLGLLPVLALRNENMDLSLESSFGIALAYLLITGAVGHFWLKSHKQGPLEKLLRKLSS